MSRDLIYPIANLNVNIRNILRNIVQKVCAALFSRLIQSCSVQVKKELEEREKKRNQLNEHAFHVISGGAGTQYARSVAEVQQNVNERWETLCTQLGVTYKKAEETKYSLRLLEAQLHELNSWMSDVEEKLIAFGIGACELTEIQEQLSLIIVSIH